jgi:integrase
MRTNGHGIRYLKRHSRRGSSVSYYYWNPPAFARHFHGFEVVSLGTDRDVAIRDTARLNARLDKYLAAKFGRKEQLSGIKPLTVGWLARTFEASPKFQRYSFSTRKEYSRIYRQTEILRYGDQAMFGNLSLHHVTHQLAYRIYETHFPGAPIGNGNKIKDAWQAAFKFASMTIPDVYFNPFDQLKTYNSLPRRQRWADGEFDKFLEAAEAQGHHSIRLYALLCMELAQRPCDILNLKWKHYQDVDGYFCIQQTKQHVEVRIPPTQRLKRALRIARRRAEKNCGEEISEQYICPTIRGKRWHKRNIARAVRIIARSAGLPDELQIRDLRRTAATEAASAGATPWEMMAAGGWQNPASIMPYLVWTPELAGSFQAKREAYRAAKTKKAASKYN